MLDDRSYMRQTPFESRRTATMVLLMVNAAAYLLQIAVTRFSDFPAEYYFALSLGGLKHGYVWQLLSYGFMHGGLMHLLFNCWAIYVFGLDVEAALGWPRYLTLYLASSILGGLAQAAAGLALGGIFASPVVGASAAAFGLVAAFALLFPDRVILLFFIIPIRARYLLWLSAGLALVGCFDPQPSGPGGAHIADAAHLGGMLAGVLFVRYALHWNWEWPRIQRPQPQASRRLVPVKAGRSKPWGRPRIAPAEEVGPDEFVSREVDPILDKISAHGIHSLTERERGILEAARTKIGKR